MSRTASTRFKIAIASAAVVVAGAWAVRVWRDASQSAEESAQRALLAESTQLLEAFHRQHGQYPDSLSQLDFTFPDGGDAATLATLQYKSDGDHFVIRVQGASTGDELKVCR